MTKTGDAKRAATEARLWALFDRIKEEKRPTGPSAFAKEAGIDRTYLYSFPLLAAEVAAYGKQTQPSISRRGAGVSKAEGKKREIEDRVRREHTLWAKEVPQLRQELAQAKEINRQRDKEMAALENRVQLFMRGYETLLLLASEAGVSPLELEELQERVFRDAETSDTNTVRLISRRDKQSKRRRGD
jgi:hypothetical protein